MLKKIISYVSCVLLVLAMTGCSGEKAVQDTNGRTFVQEKQLPEDIKQPGMYDCAEAAILYCPDRNEILYGHDIHSRRAIASITKIMTAVVALEYAAKKDIDVKITPAVYAEGSSLYLKENEVLRLTELVKGMMAVSGNDAANAVALAVGGSFEGFAAKMNQKAAQLGMKNTHFVTPSGLDSEQHYSTAYDMALLCTYAMNMPAFAEIVSERNVEVKYVFPEDKTAKLTNHNRLLSICESCKGIKTGYTSKAGRTLTSCAEREGIRLIIVTLGDRNDWDDHCRLYDQGFRMAEGMFRAGEKQSAANSESN